jgi:hypothetical protein
LFCNLGKRIPKLIKAFEQQLVESIFRVYSDGLFSIVLIGGANEVVIIDSDEGAFSKENVFVISKLKVTTSGIAYEQLWYS